ncbi:MAG: tetratricopeptide repeat protein [Treponema sp.]|nr:tetratricopeptide repeat protein [Treponema sp.]
MKEKNSSEQSKTFAKKKNHVLRNIFLVFGILILIAAAAGLTVFLINNYNKNRITLKTIKQSWAQSDYKSVYEQGKVFLQDKPYNNTALTYYGYACFYLAVSQIDTYEVQEYLDESINNLRLAMYEANNSLLPQLQYMLGKAYFYKNTITTYYYADLAIKYLTLARQNGYYADDIAEYLGLSYAALGQTYESISAFTEALLVRESDFLLLSIAEQYYKAGENGAATQYLFRIINNSSNDEIILKSRLLLGNIYIDTEDLDNALEQFNSVLEKDENSADAHYGIGLIYEKQENLVAARAEWRKARKIQPNHAGALKKLSE